MLQTYGYVGGEKKKESWGAFFLLYVWNMFTRNLNQDKINTEFDIFHHPI